MDIKLKDPIFQCIQYDGVNMSSENFMKNMWDIKHFCGDDVCISLETCEIDDYWCVRLFDTIRDKEVIVPAKSYIVKIYDVGFTYVSDYDYKKYFDDFDEIDHQKDH